MNRINRDVRRKLGIKYFLLYVLTATLFFMLVGQMLSDRIEEHLDAEKELATSTYRSIVQGYKSQADIIYYNRLNVPGVIDLFRRASSAPEAERAEIRKKLYDFLFPVYRNISLYHLKQMHFHFKNNDSFLRFHRPERFGDNLTGVRDTVAYVNKTHKPITGFEEGRIFNGYRFVYPLFDDTDYLGSVEISISMQTILEAIRQSIDVDVDFIILAKTVKSKVFKEEQKYYVPSKRFPAYMHEKTMAALSNPATEALIGKYIRSHGPLDKTLAKGDAFSFYASDGEVIHEISFVPIVNAVSKKTVAYIILDRTHDGIGFMLDQFRLFMLTVAALLALLFYLLYRAGVQRNVTEMDKQQFQSLIDLQKNIVILTDSERLQFANRFFYETFKYDSLEQFLQKHNCICDLFIRDDRYFHLGKVPEGMKWLKMLITTPATKRIVKMLDGGGKPRVYTVAVNPLADARYIVSFTDISLTISDQAELERRASRDKLTGAYNRGFLDADFYRICHAAKVQQKLLGVIMVDLDHFKRVNDTYGHNRGDEVLKTFVGIIRQTIRQEDLIVRWGGEEFLLMMMVDSLESVAAIAENVRERIETAAFEAVGQITASFGLTLYHEGESLTATVERTDKALYQAKAAGRNTVAVDEACTVSPRSFSPRRG
jgi:diguanylate cyclase (GGDEF)-like protein